MTTCHLNINNSPRNRQSQPASSSDHPLLPIASTVPSIPQTGPSASPALPDPNVDQEEEESGTTDSQRTRRYTDEDSDLVVDEALWTQLTHDQKICSNTGSFTVPRDINNQPVSLLTVQSAEIDTNFSFFAHTRQLRREYNIESVCHGLPDDDRAILTLHTQRQESLKAPTTQQLIGKKGKEATQSEIRAYDKQFLEAKLLQRKSWLDNEVFALVDTRRNPVRNWVTGRWVLTIKRDTDGNFLLTKARWVLRGFQDRQQNEQQTDSPAASRSGSRLAICLGHVVQMHKNLGHSR